MASKEIAVLGAVAIGAVILGVLWSKNIDRFSVTQRKEKFTVHQVDSPTCIPSTESLPFNSDKMNVVLQPNTVRIAIQGYNYQESPVFFRDGKKILPMEYAWNADTLTYFFTLAAPNGVCNHEWILETYDFVEPIVVNQDTYKKLQVLPIRRRLGYNRWQLLC